MTELERRDAMHARRVAIDRERYFSTEPPAGRYLVVVDDRLVPASSFAEAQRLAGWVRRQVLGREPDGLPGVGD